MLEQVLGETLLIEAVEENVFVEALGHRVLESVLKVNQAAQVIVLGSILEELDREERIHHEAVLEVGHKVFRNVETTMGEVGVLVVVERKVEIVP